MVASFAFITPERELALATSPPPPLLPGEGSGAGRPFEVRTLVSRSAARLRGEDDSQPVALTSPTWSLDGSQIAFSAIYRTSAQQTGSALAVVGVETGVPEVIFQGAPGLAGLIAPGLPHYVNWSPDGRHLALLTQVPAGMTLFIVDRLGIKPATPVVSGAPLFFAWSPSGDALIVQRAGDLLLVEASAPESPSMFPPTALGCVLPAWSPSGDAVALVRPAGRGAAVCLLGRDGDEKQIAPIAAPGAAVAWRPGAVQLAYSPRPPGAAAAGRGLLLAGVDGSDAERLSDLAVIAFYWSPDGSRLGFLSPGREPSLCAWSTIDIEARSTVRFAPFYQSAELALTLAFFEQYATSHRLWSPAGDALLVSGRMPSNGTPAGTGGGNVYVQPVAANAAVAFAVQGTFASWRPA